MEQNHFPAPGWDPFVCPVCGWSPCTAACRLGLTNWEVEALRQQFEDSFPTPPPGGEGLGPADYCDEGDFE